MRVTRLTRRQAAGKIGGYAAQAAKYEKLALADGSDWEENAIRARHYRWLESYWRTKLARSQ